VSEGKDYKWLLVYDNVESPKDVLPFWPETSHGKAVLTTRSSSLAYELATSGIEVNTWNPQTGSEFLLFLLKRAISNDLDIEGQSALELSKRLSGHALGIAHMAGLIHRRSSSISEFMKMYLKNPSRSHKNELQALWEYSFRELGSDSAAMLGIASFLMPDSIPQALFEMGDLSDLPDEIAFLSDEAAFVFLCFTKLFFVVH
jgi:hypothetical protein